MGTDAVAPNPCFMGLYFIGWILLYLCPVIGQLMGLRVWCNHDKYLGHPNKSERVMARISLFLCTYGIGYVLIYCLYYLGKWYIQGWEWSTKKENYGEKEWSKGKTGVLFLSCGTYFIYWLGAKYFNLWEYGLEKENHKKPWGRIALLCASFGLYTIVLLIEGYINLWQFGLDNVKKDSKWDQFLGHGALLCVTFGLYIIFKLWQGYKYLFGKGLQWRYSGDDNHGMESNKIEIVGGGLLLVLLTCGLFIIFEILYWYVRAWDYSVKLLHKETWQDRYRGHFYIGLLSFGIYIPVRLIYQYYRGWVYGLQYFSDNEEHIKAKLMLLGVSCGLYGFVQLGFWYIDAWKYGIAKRTSEDYHERMRGHGTLLLVSLFTYSIFLLGVLYYDGWHYGIKYYEDADDKSKNVWGGFLLMIVTFGLFSIFYAFVLYFRLWCYGIDQYYYNCDGFAYVMFNYTGPRSNTTMVRNVWGGFILTICSCGLFVLFQLGSWYCRLFVYACKQYGWEYKEKIYNNAPVGHPSPIKNHELEKNQDEIEMRMEYDVESAQASVSPPTPTPTLSAAPSHTSNNWIEQRSRILWGSLLLTFLTLGLFILYQLIVWYVELIMRNWLYLFGNDTDSESNGMTKTGIAMSHVILTISTCGIYLIVLYFYQMFVTYECLKSPPDHKKNKLGWSKIYWYTFGVGFIVKNVNSKNTTTRYVSKFFLTILTGGLFLLYELIGFIWYSNVCRFYIGMFISWCEKNKNNFKHWFETNVSHPTYVRRVYIINSVGGWRVNTSNYFRSQYAAFSNWRMGSDPISPGESEYSTPYVETFEPSVVIPMKSFDEKTEKRISDGLIAKSCDKAFEALCIIHAKLRTSYRNRFGYEGFKHDLMYIERSIFTNSESPIVFNLTERVDLNQYTLAEIKFKDVENSVPELGLLTQAYNEQKLVYDNYQKGIVRRIKFLKDLVKNKTDLKEISIQLNKMFDMNSDAHSVLLKYDFNRIYRNVIYPRNFKAIDSKSELSNIKNNIKNDECTGPEGTQGGLSKPQITFF